MIDGLIAAIFVLSRYLHIVAAGLIVGGTTFYLWVVPFAINELKPESQLSVFARARIIFRRTVFFSAVVLLITGGAMFSRNLPIYDMLQIPLFRDLAVQLHPKDPPVQMLDQPGLLDRPGVWIGMHIIASTLCLVIAVGLVRGRTPPPAPLAWMRTNFVLLLITILLAVMCRNAAKRLFESIHPFADDSVPAAVHD
jgi:hypothetical protein